MSKNKIRFEIEDTEYSFSYKKSDLKIDFNRIAFIFFILVLISIIFSIHLIHLGSRQSKIEKEDNLRLNSNSPYRADIVDRENNYLVKTVKSIDIGINPVEIIDKKKLLLNLRYIFPEKNFQEIETKIKKNKFFWFEKKISEENYEKIMKLGDKSIKPHESLTRLYPHKNLFSHIIGQIDDDNYGISGIEKSFDEKLKQRSEPLELTVDSDIQFLIRKELIKYNEIFNTKGSAAVLMNINSGEIIAFTSLQILT